MEHIKFEKEDQIAIITINNPPANALARYIFEQLSNTFDMIEQDDLIKVVVVKGEGKFFSAGADIKEFTTVEDSSEFQALAEKTQLLYDRIEQLSIPVIAAIHGAALGGGLELALSCHIRYATENAKLGLPEVNLGIIPGFAGTQRLPQIVGTAKAFEMILSGKPINGKEAYHIGLVNQVVKEEELMEKVIELAKTIASKSKLSINQIMRLVPYTKQAKLSEGASAEAKAFGEIFSSNDAKEGIQAFMEKRKPNFSNR